MISLLVHAASVFGSALAAGVWQGLLLTLLVGSAMRLVPGIRASRRFAIWAMLLTLIVCLPFLEEGLQHDKANSIMHIDPRWSLLLGALWLGLSSFRLVELGRCVVRLRGLRKSAVLVTETLPALSRAELLRHRAVLCTSEEVDRPSVIGFFAPCILIPHWLLEQLSGPELEQILLHELEHLRRRDDWLNLLQKVTVALLPLNPVVLWIEHRLCRERELACDDGVLQRTRAPRSYASCLTRLAERGLERRVDSLALGATGARSNTRKPELAERVYRMLRNEPVLRRGQAHVFTASLAAGVLCLVGGLLLCPELISFGPGVAAQAGVPNFARGPISSHEALKWSAVTPDHSARRVDAPPALRQASLTLTNVHSHFQRSRLHRKAKASRVFNSAPPGGLSSAIVRSEMRLTAARGTEPQPAPEAAPLDVSAEDAVASNRPVLLQYIVVQLPKGWALIRL